MAVYFGPGGNSDSFEQLGYKSNIDVCKYLKNMNLNAYEYEAGRGIKITKAAAEKFGETIKNAGIKLSFHSPYFISLSTGDDEMRTKTINYIVQSCETAAYMGAKRVVVHSGALGKMTRAEAFENSKYNLKLAINELVERKLDNVIICPETMGKINQIGDAREVSELCKIDESLIPCIDFGHLNARTLGGIKNKKDYEDILNLFENEIGFERMSKMHIHFSKIEYTKGGEKKHLTFDDQDFGPDYKPLIEIIAKRNLSPVIICESSGTQAEDASVMKKYYEQLMV